MTHELEHLNDPTLPDRSTLALVERLLGVAEAAARLHASADHNIRARSKEVAETALDVALQSLQALRDDAPAAGGAPR